MYIFIRFIATSEQGRIFACPASPTNKNGCKSTAIIRRISPLCKKNDEIFHQLRIEFCIILKICLLASENFTVKPVYPGVPWRVRPGLPRILWRNLSPHIRKFLLEWLIRGEGEIVRPNGPEEAPADLLEMARRVIEAKDEIIELQKNRIDWLTARLSEKG